MNYLGEGGYYFVLTDAGGKGKKRILLPRETTDEIFTAGDAVYQVELSGDGKWVGFVGGDHYYLLDIASEKITRLSGYAHLLESINTYHVEWGLSFSPDSKYLTYLDGEDTQSCENPDPFPCRLFLNVFSLSERRVVWRKNLLPADFPANLDELFKRMGDVPADAGDYYRAGVLFTFYGGIASLTWSPDGRYLAFSGAIDGPSADVYVLEPDAGKLQRLTDGIENVTYLRWTSDGKYVIHHASLIIGCAPGCGTDYIAGLEGGTARKILPNFCGYYAQVLGWISSTKILCTGAEWGNVLGAYDMLTDSSTTLLAEYPTTMAIDPESRQILMAFAKRPAMAEFDAGYYFFDPIIGSSHSVAPNPWCDIPRAAIEVDISALRFGVYRFRLHCGSGTALVGLQGETIGTDHALYKLIPSPKWDYLLNIDEEKGTIEILSADLQVLHTLEAKLAEDGARSDSAAYAIVKPFLSMDRFAYLIRWRADEAGFFYQSAAGLEYADLATGETRLVDDEVDLMIGWVVQ